MRRACRQPTIPTTIPRMTSDANEPPFVDADVFAETLGSILDAIRNLCAAVGSVEPRKGHNPWDGSNAMRDLEEQAKRYSGIPRWDEPVKDAHSFGGMTLMAATDYAESFARLFGPDGASLFGHLVLARATIEAAVVSAWLSDPAITTAERVQRALCEHLYSESELGHHDFIEDAEVRIARWTTAGEALGWRCRLPKYGKPSVCDTQRPGIGDGLGWLLGTPDSDSARSEWRYLSAVSHVTWYGIARALEGPRPPQSPLGPTLANVGIASVSVQVQGLYVLRALRHAADARFALMGWIDDEWQAASYAAEEFAIAFVPQVQAIIDERARQRTEQ